MDQSSVVLKMHLALHNDPFASRIRALEFFVPSVFVEMPPIGVSLEGEFTLVRDSSLLQVEVNTVQAEETLEACTV